MKFTIPHDTLRYVAGVMAELGDATFSPARKSIILQDIMRVRRMEFSPPDPYDVGGSDVGLDCSTIQKVARRIRGESSVHMMPERMVIQSGHATYNIRILHPIRMDEVPKCSHLGNITLPAADMRAAMEDVRAAGVSSLVILADGDTAMFRGQGTSDCRVEVPSARVEGGGYSRLDLDLLYPCVPTTDLPATIHLSPKSPTLIQFGDHARYYQAPQT